MKKISIMMSLMLIACLSIWLIGQTTEAESTTPGSVEDPIVTKSYVDQQDAKLDLRITALENAGTPAVASNTSENAMSEEEIKAYVDSKVSEALNSIDTTTANQSGQSSESTTNATDDEVASEPQKSMLFVVVEAQKGESIICGASAEIVVRSGSAIVVPGINGDGLADLTSGEDLSADQEIPNQHHLLVSRDDGRGVKITSEDTAYVLVKGDYKVTHVE